MRLADDMPRDGAKQLPRGAVAELPEPGDSGYGWSKKLQAGRENCVRISAMCRYWLAEP